MDTYVKLDTGAVGRVVHTYMPRDDREAQRYGILVDVVDGQSVMARGVPLAKCTVMVQDKDEDGYTLPVPTHRAGVFFAARDEGERVRDALLARRGSLRGTPVAS